jgi:hypothetical protein
MVHTEANRRLLRLLSTVSYVSHSTVRLFWFEHAFARGIASDFGRTQVNRGIGLSVRMC